MNFLSKNMQNTRASEVNRSLQKQDNQKQCIEFFSFEILYTKFLKFSE